jgi:hypothetical protein
MTLFLSEWYFELMVLSLQLLFAAFAADLRDKLCG